MRSSLVLDPRPTDLHAGLHSQAQPPDPFLKKDNGTGDMPQLNRKKKNNASLVLLDKVLSSISRFGALQWMKNRGA
jgi:hypothetical protein